jgi:phosphoheptose isomerase
MTSASFSKQGVRYSAGDVLLALSTSGNSANVLATAGPKNVT